MQRRKGVGKRGWPRRARGLSLPAFLLLLPWLAGCAGDRAVANDPLIGGEVPRAAAQAQNALPAKGVPPLPPANSATNTASLAQNQPLPGGRELGMDEPRGTMAKNTWDGPGKPGDESGTVLDRPQPIVPVSRSTLDPVHGLSEFEQAGGPGTYEQLQAALTSKGMNWYRQEKWGDGVKFVCTIPNATNPNKVRTYEAVAGTDVAALRAVLDKINQGS